MQVCTSDHNNVDGLSQLQVQIMDGHVRYICKVCHSMIVKESHDPFNREYRRFHKLCYDHHEETMGLPVYVKGTTMHCNYCGIEIKDPNGTEQIES